MSTALSKDGYLKFGKELDYFTGKYRDQAEVVRRSLDLVEDFYRACDLKMDLRRFDEIPVAERLLTPGGLASIERDVLDNPDIDKEREEWLDAIDKSSNIVEMRAVDNLPDDAALVRISKEIPEFINALLITSAVFRNSELVDEADLKHIAYHKLVHYWCEVLLKMLDSVPISVEEKKDALREMFPDADPSLLVYMMKLFVPNIISLMLRESLGTSKLQLVISDNIKSSEETVIKLLSTVLYSDLYLPNRLDYIETLLRDKGRHRFLMEILYYKLLHIFLFENANENEMKRVRRLVGDLYVTINDYGGKRASAYKSKFLQSLDKTRPGVLH